ncbi:MAG: YheV family putative metal-binding protein [Acinetobacter sp.]|jgi:uncharacterized metal-binding protein (TIGR02443 family)|nr:MAG: YheV family putative metal-binding protein [Acinetobacter sp.]
MMTKKRFIAGAKCPKCQAQDKVVMITTADAEWIECIECNYSEQRPTEVEAEIAELPDDVGVIQFKPQQK